MQSQTKFVECEYAFLQAFSYFHLLTGDKAVRRQCNQQYKECQNHAQRVQNSVFECIMDNAKTKVVKAKLLEIIDMDKDSLRFYYLGNAYKNKVEHIGAHPGFDVTETLIL